MYLHCNSLHVRILSIYEVKFQSWNGNQLYLSVHRYSKQIRQIVMLRKYAVLPPFATIFDCFKVQQLSSILVIYSNVAQDGQAPTHKRTHTHTHTCTHQ